MTEDEEAGALAREVDALEHQIGTLEDIQAIRALQFKYGYYLDKCLVEEVVDFFAEDCELNFMGSIWRGKSGVSRVYIDQIGVLFSGGTNGPVDGFMCDHEILQDIIDVAPDRMSAKGRLRYFTQGATHHSRPTIPGMPPQWFEGGVYENIYVKESGVWKIKRLDVGLAFRCDYQTGWRYARAGAGEGKPALYPENPVGPDAWEPGRSATWPKAFAQPFHYPHPVTGRVWTFLSPLPVGGAERPPARAERGRRMNSALGEGSPASGAPLDAHPSPKPLPRAGGKQDVAQLNNKLDELQHRAGVLADMDAIRKLQFTYGYLMDKYLFDEVVELFAADGELRFDGNLYRGHAGVRRVYVDLIGKLYTKGVNRPVDGVLADHTQMQDVITVAPDRRAANGRFRYFMQGATHESYGEPLMPQGSFWEGGVYENEYVRDNGVWKIKVLGLCGSYRVDYQAGWRWSIGFVRTKPALYPENPGGPDAYYEGKYPSWPSAYVIPFHYEHPVTGKPWIAK